MAERPRNIPLSVEQCCVPTLLDSFLYSITEELLVLAHGFNRGMIAGLVEGGLAIAQREVVTASGHTTIEVVRIRISNAGRQVLEN
jgi:hypothetical protein